jgi:DNA-binding LacI/PurR family transcriptional regulator
MNLSNASESERVRRYLLHKILHSGNQQMRLPTEMALVKTLQVSRVTVRRAIDDLIRGNYIQKLPNKQGIYTNPAMVDVTMHSIAILQSTNYLDSRLMSVLGSMSSELLKSKCFCSINFFITGNHSFEFVHQELSNCGFDCILAFSVNPFANKLLAKGLPILIIETPGYPNIGEGNFVAFDNEAFGRQVANEMIKQKLNKVLFLGDLTAIKKGFCEANLGQLEISFYEDYLNKEGLKEVLKNGQFSGIAAMTREVGLRTLYDALHELPQIELPKLYLYPWKESELFKRSNPRYYTEHFNSDAFIDGLLSLGKATAIGVKQIIDDLPIDIPLVKLQ